MTVYQAGSRICRCGFILIMCMQSAGFIVDQHVAWAQTQDSERISQLIAQLNARTFNEREQASAELLKIGEPALTALAAIDGNASAEVRVRAAMIREQIDERVFLKLSDEFLRDPNPENSHSLPAWSVFSRVVGNTRSAKPLFLEMVARQRELVRLIEDLAKASRTQEASGAEVLRKKFQLRAEADNVARKLESGLMLRKSAPELGDTVALIMTAIQLDQNVSTEIHFIINASLNKTAFRAGIRKPGYDLCLKKMLGRWIPTTPAFMSEEMIALALYNDIPEGVIIARRVLAGKADHDLTEWSLKCLARYGNEDDIPIAEKYLDDPFELARLTAGDLLDPQLDRIAPPGGRNLPSAEEPAKLVARMSDLALATCMTLAKQDLSGTFPNLQLLVNNMINVKSLAFPVASPEVREQAIQRWKQSRPPKKPVVGS